MRDRNQARGIGIEKQGRAPDPLSSFRPRTPTPLRRGFLLPGGARRRALCLTGARRAPLASDLSAGRVAADLDLALLEINPDDGMTDLVGVLDHHLVGNGIPGRSHGRPGGPIVSVTDVLLRLAAVGFVAADHPGFRRLLIAEPLAHFGSDLAELAVVTSQGRGA